MAALQASFCAAQSGVMCMDWRIDHRVPAMGRSRAAARSRQDLPSGNAPTTRVRCRHVAEAVAVEMHDAGLPARVGQLFRDALDQGPG
jgi:hypothetical protein